MHWELLIPVIAIAVYILSSLIRNAEDDKKGNRLPPAPGGRPGRSTSEIDRFLEEIQRRRRQTEERKPSPEEVVPIPARPAGTGAARRRRPRPVPPQEGPPRRRPSLETPVPRSLTVGPVEVVIESASPSPPWSLPTPLTSAVDFPQAEEQPPSPPPPPSPPAPGGLAHGVSPALAQLRSLLRSPHSMQTAIMLREILDRPRCRRRRV